MTFLLIPITRGIIWKILKKHFFKILIITILIWTIIQQVHIHNLETEVFGLKAFIAYMYA